MRIAYIDILYEDSEVFEEIVIEMRKHVSDDTVIDYHYVKGTNNLEYEVFEVFIMPEIIKKIDELRHEGYDAAVIGCFYDPAIDAAKELFDDIIIVGPGESAMVTALRFGKDFSLIIPSEKTYSKMADSVEKIGLASRMASIRTIGLNVVDLQNDHAILEEKMSKAISTAINEDHAEVIVLACTMETGQYKKLQAKFNMPIIDPTVAALMQARMEYECRKQCDWKYSRACKYKQPPADDAKRFLGITL